MKRALILGAGFSKAVADLPLTKEMFDKFKEVSEQQRLSNKNNRVKWYENIITFVKKLENDYLIKPNDIADPGSKIIESNYLNNFEAICSIIDLNLSSEVQARSEKNNIRASLFNKPLFLNTDSGTLKMIRGYIGTYLFFSLINYKLHENLIEKFYNVYIDGKTSIVTFNYDLVLDQFLFKKKIWFPKDGYGFLPDNIPKINPVFEKESKILLLKLHGSLNWKKDKLKKCIELIWKQDSNDFLFPKYLYEESTAPWENRGGYNTDALILPSWIKSLSYKEIIEVWKKAFNVINNSEEIIFIGYSLPEADSAVFSLLNSIDYTNKKITIIDKNAANYKEKYQRITGRTDLSLIDQPLEKYLTS